MTTKTPATKAAPKAPEAPKEPEGIKPLFAIHAINPFSNGKSAPAGSIFTPDTAQERDELIALGAARDLDEVEASAYRPPVDDIDPAEALG